jgi:hypothetical protein
MRASALPGPNDSSPMTSPWCSNGAALLGNHLQK